MIGSQKPLIFKLAAWSNGVYWMLIMQTVAFRFSAMMGTLAEGFTVNDEPIQSKKSQSDAWRRAFPRSYTGNF